MGIQDVIENNKTKKYNTLTNKIMIHKNLYNKKLNRSNSKKEKYYFCKSPQEMRKSYSIKDIKSLYNKKAKKSKFAIYRHNTNDFPLILYYFK